MKSGKLRNRVTWLLYDRQIEGKQLRQMKSSFQEVSKILQSGGEGKKKSAKK